MRARSLQRAKSRAHSRERRSNELARSTNELARARVDLWRHIALAYRLWVKSFSAHERASASENTSRAMSIMSYNGAAVIGG